MGFVKFLIEIITIQINLQKNVNQLVDSQPLNHFYMDLVQYIQGEFKS